MKVKMAKEKETKRTVRFKEISEQPRLGIVYIPKSTLESLEWTDGDKLIISLEKE